MEQALRQQLGKAQGKVADLNRQVQMSSLPQPAGDSSESERLRRQLEEERERERRVRQLNERLRQAHDVMTRRSNIPTSSVPPSTPPYASPASSPPIVTEAPSSPPRLR